MNFRVQKYGKRNEWPRNKKNGPKQTAFLAFQSHPDPIILLYQ